MTDAATGRSPTAHSGSQFDASGVILEIPSDRAVRDGAEQRGTVPLDSGGRLVPERRAPGHAGRARC
jgi:hypothetical protein